MINFANPQYIFLFLLIPVFFIIYGIMRRLRKRKIARIGNPELVGSLMPSRSKAKGWVRISLFSAAFFFFVIGLMRPQIGARLKEQEKRGAEIVIALDVSNSMLAEDYSPNRLERAKLSISALVDRLRDDRIGLVIFAGSSFVQLPITADYVSAKIFLNSISTESIPVQGTAIGDALMTSIRSFSSQSEGSRAIILITDGENHEDDPVAVAKEAADMGIRVFCIGVGSPEGEPIPYDGSLLKDKDGNIVVTKLDESVLKEVASVGNGLYVRAGNSEFGLNPIIDEIRSMDAERFKSVVFEDFDEQYMYFFAIALALLVIEMLIGERRTGRKLFATALVLALSVTVASAQPDRSEVRKGNRDFKRESYGKADIDYRKALLKDSMSVAANYNLANTLYRQGNFDAAASFYGKLADSTDLGKYFSDYHYNVGNLALEQKDYAKAVESYKNALRRNPADLDAKENLAYAQKMLKDQQNQQNQQNQQQNQDNQDNKDNDRKDNQQNQDNQQQNPPDDNKQDDRQSQDNRQQSQSSITPQAAQQMLQAIQAKEKKTQDKVNKEKAKALKSKEKEKNW